MRSSRSTPNEFHGQLASRSDLRATFLASGEILFKIDVRDYPILGRSYPIELFNGDPLCIGNFDLFTQHNGSFDFL